MKVRLRTAGLKTAAVAATTVAVMAPAFVAAGDAAAITQTKIIISTNSQVFVAGQTVKIGVHILNAPNAPITYWETIPGVGTKRIYVGRADARGYDAISGPADHNAVYTAKFGGNSTHSASAASIRVYTRVKVASKAAGGSKSGKYRYYKARAQATLSVAVAPTKAGQRVYFPLQVLSGGKWKTVIEHSYTLNSNSAVGIYYTGSSGRYYRVRGEYKGDKTNAPNYTAWTYAHFG